MKPIRELLKAYRNGDFIPTPDLVRLRDHMKELADLSRECGEVFALQTVYADQVYMNCRGFINARGVPKK